jgi:hypothetical protein
MDRERAETFLRLLVEAELRRVTARPEDRAAHAGGIARVIRVARALTAVGALGELDVGRVLDDFELALVRRRAGTPAQYGRDLRWLMRSSSPRQPPAASDHAVPGGQVIPVRGDEVSGEVTLLSYAQTESGALLTFVARPGQLNPVDPEGPWSTMPSQRPVPRRPGLVIIPFRQFTATDDRGASYRMGYIGTGRPPGEWILRLYPHPPRDLSWLDLSATPGEPAVRIDLNPKTPAGRPQVTISHVTRSPAEQLLNNLAMRLLATGAVFPQDVRIVLAELALAPAPFPDTAEGLGDVVAALQASGALPPLSPVPGQLAALCAQLDVTGHGLTVPPARDLPEPWLGVLAHHQQARSHAAPGPGGCAAVAAVLPELDGTRLTILGLTSSADGTILHTHASGATCHTYYGPPEGHLAPAVWLRDSRGRWHATRVGRYHEGDMTMRLEVMPPLSQATAWIEVLAAGQSAEVRVTLPLRWQ